jgi:hypothetical protein
LTNLTGDRVLGIIVFVSGAATPPVKMASFPAKAYGVGCDLGVGEEAE